MTLPAKNPLQQGFAYTDPKTGQPTQVFAQYMQKMDALVTALAAGNLPSTLVNAASDAAAAKAGVPIGVAYRNGSTLHVRVV